ncbi:hypothetical protein [Ulvibacterium sp.]|uniref:hypothetical protein n=1 Tax=Ulvibacterium sp. TaxID=2665914 RepID=UPI0026168776|nr:hypothetical protein [Ulvibacterium sp.]
MNIFETSYKPLDFKSKFGTPLKIYSTTFSKDLFTIFVFSILSLVLGILTFYYSNFEETGKVWIAPLLVTIGFTIPAYIYLGNRFRYIALFEKGLVIKKRFRVYEIFYRDIEEIKLVNALPYKNLLKSKTDKEYAFDAYLKNSDIISFGISERIFKAISYPRIYSGVRVIDIKDFVERTNLKIKNTTHNIGYISS